MADELKQIPDALYPCRYCSEDYSWPAGDLFWSELDHDWVCDPCWDQRDSNWDGENSIETEFGISLANEIKSRAVNCHDELVAALEGLVWACECAEGEAMASKEIDAAYQALSKAKGGA